MSSLVLFSPLILLATVLVLGAEAFYNPYAVGEQPEQQTVCQSVTSACRVRITMRYPNNTSAGEIGTPLCACPNGHQCPTNFTASRANVISRNLFSAPNTMTLDMMFCQPLPVQRNCTQNDEALEVWGRLILPLNVRSHNCQCQNPAQPLMLQRRWIGEDYLNYQSYVCPEHKAICPYRISQCIISHDSSVFYHCQCPAGSYCRMLTPLGRNRAFGYCRPRPRTF